MRGFNQEMFYGQLLTGRERLRAQLPRHAAGRHRPQPVGRPGRELPAHRPRRARRLRLRARARRLHGRLHAHVLAGPAGRGAPAGLRRRPARAGGGDGRGPARRDLPRRLGGRAGRRRGGRPGRQLHGPRRRPGARTWATASASSSTSCRCSPAATSSSSPAWSSRSSPSSSCPALGAIGIENTWVVTGDGVERLTLAPDESPSSADRRRSGSTGGPRAGKSEPAGPGTDDGGETMKQLAPDVWTHAIDAEGFPTLDGRRPHAAPRHRRRHAHRAPRDGPRRRVPRRARPATAACRGREHAPPLGPRVRQRRLRRRGHRRAARLPAPHPGGAAERRRVAAPAAVGGRARCPTSPSATGSPTATTASRSTSSTRRATARTRWSSSSPRPAAARPATPSSGRCPTSASATVPEEWVRTLRQLKQLPVDLIVPAHGPAMDKQIIDANERYVARRLRGGRRGQGRRRRPRRARPAGRALPRRRRRRRRRVRGRHRENLLWAWDEV